MAKKKSPGSARQGKKPSRGDHYLDIEDYHYEDRYSADYDPENDFSFDDEDWDKYFELDDEKTEKSRAKKSE